MLIILIKEVTGGLNRSWWCHQLKTFFALLALCEGNPAVTSLIHGTKSTIQSVTKSEIRLLIILVWERKSDTREFNKNSFNPVFWTSKDRNILGRCAITDTLVYRQQIPEKVHLLTRIMERNLTIGQCTFPHYIDVIMTTMASQITSLTVVYSAVYSDADQRNIKAPRHWPLCGEFTGTGEFPAQRASYAENASSWWRHHETRLWLETAIPMLNIPNTFQYKQVLKA